MRAATLLLVPLLLLALSGQPALAQPPSNKTQAQPNQWIPPELQAWQGWVLLGQEGAACPPSALDPSVRECLFPTRAVIQAGASGASFTVTWRVLAAGNVPLPFAKGTWPSVVRVDGQPAAVLDDSGTPQVRLSPGEHQVTGALVWKRRPQVLTLPAATGLVDLSVDGRQVAFPRLADGRLDLAQGEEAKAPEESAKAAVFRLVSDGVPMTVATLVRLEVSGRSRTIALDGLLPPDTVPMAVRAQLPVGFGPDGQVMVQAGAGRHDIEITSRFKGPVDGFGPAGAPFGREIWAFKAAPDLRDLQVSGQAPIDSKTTELPEGWKQYPAWLAEAGARLEFSEIRRGEAGPRGDDLHVQRTFWLDFSGKGLTVKDRLTGTLRHGWSLAMALPGELGRAGTPEGDLPVVILGQEGLSGVELRQAAVNLTAESRYPDPSTPIPATGWRQDAASLSAELNLPPGWRLFDASGPDTVSHSWVSQWNLLNIFLTLFMGLGAFKLRGPLAAAALLAFLVAAQHEPGAPVEAWLPLLAALGLAKVFSLQGRAESWQRVAKGARVLHLASLAGLVLLSLPFVAGQIRTAVYPQLEEVGRYVPYVQEEAAPVSQKAMAPAPAPLEGRTAGKAARRDVREETAGKSLEQDPKSLVQTGPGLPSWHWRQIRLGWNGPVGQGQFLRLVLVSPALSSGLCLARVALLLAALALLSGFGLPRPGRGMKTAVAAVLALLTLAWAGPARAEAFPSKEMLEEFRQRLLKPAECFPHCAGISEMAVALDAQSLRLTLTVGAAARLALPLPVVSDGWRPGTVTVDGKPADLFFAKGGLWVLLAEGPHVVVMTGNVPAGVSFTVSTPFPARTGRADAPGWSVLGLGPDGVLEGGLTFTRKEEGSPNGKPSMTAVIPPFLEVERVLGLGLSWEATTTVRRLTRSGEPVTLAVPLLPGESVLGQEVRVEDGKAVATLAAGQRQLTWRSRLETVPSLELAAPTGVPWVETWRMSASPAWDVALSGIPAVASLDAAGRWSPLWRPWPGEKAVIAVTRPAPAPGESLTVDSASLRLAPGARLDADTLLLRLRSALGGRHVLKLPQGAEITGVSIDGRGAPWSSDKPGEVGVALAPGAQDVSVSWRQPREGLGRVITPEVGLAHPAVNASLAIDMPHDRWILWARGGTSMGPAVLFWSAVALCAVVAVALGFLPWTPLKWWHWFLLGLGLTQVDAGAAVMAVAWIIALGARRRYLAASGWLAFNFVQVLLVVLTFLGLTSLFEAIRTGLLGVPLTNITGNGSSAYHLAWYFDRVGEALPRAEVFSVSLWWYRGLMLAWSLWMAVSLLRWLRWGWESFCEGGAWRKGQMKIVKPSGARSEDEGPEQPVLREGLRPDDPQEKKE